MPAEHFISSEQIEGGGPDKSRPQPSLAELEARHAAEQELRANIAAEEAAAQEREWPPKAEADLLAELDDFAGPTDPDSTEKESADEMDLDDLFADLDDMDAKSADPSILHEGDTGLKAGDDDLADLFGELDALEADEADPDARRQEVLTWVEVTFPTLQPPEKAADFCCQYEEERKANRPDYDVQKDPHIEEEIRRKFLVTETAQTKVAVEAASTSDAWNEADLGRQDRVEAKQDAIEEISSLDDLIEPYNKMLPRLGQIKTLQALMEQTDSPEIKGRLAAILATFDKVRSVVSEGAQPEMERIFNAAPLNLSGASVVDAFVPILAAVDASETLPAETKAAIREAVYGEHYVRTGGDVRESATAMTTNENGETVPVYTVDSPRSIRPGVSAYSETGDEVLVRLNLPGHPPVTREVTGWSNDDIGLLTEAMGFAAGLEEYGVTGFVEDIYKIDFNVLGDSAFDRDSLRDIRQMISAMVGSFEGYDGDIFDVREKIGLIRHQARLLSEEDTAYGTENSREDTLRSARKLGLRNEDGELNFAVLKEFGRYSQETYLSEDASHADLHARLYGLFPEFLAEPDSENTDL